ncbi:hypothetical protein [Micrococcus sp. IITD107]|uniref:hypothetical protein n=1 Tax=Micrococcus sp. IITD107 TaxID=3342790 RepID=UPI0035BB013D
MSGGLDADPGRTGRTDLTGLVYLAVGPERHGVVRHGLATARELIRQDGSVDLVHLPDAEGLREWSAGNRAGGVAVHLDVTDSLFGDAPREAVALLTEALEGNRTTLTLHDVPQPAEGAARYAARAAAYADLAQWAAGIVVSSAHERTLLERILTEHGGGSGTAASGPAASSESAPRITVVPLPVPDRRDPDAVHRARTDPAAWARQLPEELSGLDQDVVVLGFLYPGKGHAEALQALAAVRSQQSRPGSPAELPSRVTALGPVAAGHDHLVGELTEQAEALGLSFRATGFVADEHLDAALLAAGIPVAAHRNVSASGSLASWMSVGRRAIVPAGTYTQEMDRLRPGTLAVQPTADPLPALTAGIAAATTDPGLTWLDSSASLAPGPQDCAGALLQFLTETLS